jgi:phosphoglycerate dehydrogenase-like enzyme
VTVVVLASGTEDWAEAARSAIGSAAHEFAVTLGESRTDPVKVTAIVGVVGPVPVSRYPNLLWVHSAAAGVDGVLTPELRSTDVILTSAAGNGGIPLAEHALMLMLILGRSALRWLSAQGDRRWERFSHAELAGRTVVIVGMGAAGRDLAAKAKACHMRVVAITRTPRPHIPNVDVVAQPVSMAETVADCDFLVVAAPLTLATQGLVGETVLRAMPPYAVVICVSRGGIIDEQALVAALREERLAGAGLDAIAVEPLPPSSPLWELPNVIITPHNAATTDGTERRGTEILIRNLRRFAAGQPLGNVVDKNEGY